MALQIESVATPHQFRIFLDLPYSIHKNNPLWVPPLKKEEAALLTPGQHPFWNTARRELFLAYRDGVPVGRIAAIIDEKYNSYAQVACGAFGFFESENDPEAAALLLEICRAWLVKNGQTFMRGPLNPSTNYTCALLVQGFDKAPALMMPWNPPYYASLLESCNLRKEKDMFAYVLNKDKIALPDWIVAEMARIKSERQFSFRSSSKKSLREDTGSMLEIYRLSWAQNWGFSPLSPEEADNLAKELTAILDPELFVLFFHNGKPVAGMVALPDFNPLLKRLHGKMGITAPWHYLKTRKALRKVYRIMLFGILPEYRLQGLPMLLLDYLLQIARKRNDFEAVEGSWVLEDNGAIDQLIEDFGGQLVKRYRIYRQEIAPCQN